MKTSISITYSKGQETHIYGACQFPAASTDQLIAELILPEVIGDTILGL